MKLVMTQPEIERAIRNEVSNMGIDLSNKETQVDLIAGRGPEGFKAEIEILETSAPVTEAASADTTETDEEPKDSDAIFGGNG
jgi:hypothetical protein